jgi:transposase
VGSGLAGADLGGGGRGRLGRLLAQQLAAAGERVLDVQPKLASRVRLLQAGATNKNDPNDALSVAVAALRSKTARPVMAEDYPAVLKVRAERHRDLARLRNQVACRLHAVLCDLVPGGHSKEISAAQAARILEQASPSGAVDQARAELAAEFLQDMRRLDAQLRDTRKKLAAAVRASGTTLTGLFGVGPVIAGTIIGDIADVYRFPGRGHFAAYNGTAPVEVSSGNRKIYRLSLRGNRRINHAIHMAAITQIRHRHSDGRAYYDKKVAEGKDAQRSAPVPQAADQRRHLRLPPSRRAPSRTAASGNGPGGQPGNDSDSSAAGSHPERRLFGQATPGPGHHDTARHQGNHTLTAEADFKENPDNHLTAVTKRTRYGARPGRRGWLCEPRANGHSVAPANRGRARGAGLVPGGAEGRWAAEPVMPEPTGNRTRT